MRPGLDPPCGQDPARAFLGLTCARCYHASMKPSPKPSKSMRKSVMSRLQPLRPGQRIDYRYLVAQGIPLAEARAIAQAYAADKEDVDKADGSDATAAYYKAFHAASMRLLPDWQHAMVHRSARGKAGAHGLKMSRYRADDDKAALLDEADSMGQRIKEIHGQLGADAVRKTSVLGSEAHVDVPLTLRPARARRRRKRDQDWIKKWDEGSHPRADDGKFGAGGSSGKKDSPSAKSSEQHFADSKKHRDNQMRAARSGDEKEAAGHKAAAAASHKAGMKAFAQESAKRRGAAIPVHKAARIGIGDRELAYIQAAYGLQVPTESQAPDGDALGADGQLEGYLEANRLIAGMDAEMMAGATDAEQARTLASRTLQQRPGFYDGIGAEPEIKAMHGLLIDIGSGTARKPGWLGLDIFAYDHGTILHDAELGLPFPDASVRGIRLANALHPILDAPMANPDPVPLLTECQRVLMEGGCLYYEGPEPLIEANHPWPLPGLVLAYPNDTAVHQQAAPDGGVYKQTLKRVPLRVPAYHGADSTYAPAGPMSVELQMALAAYNAAPADKAMANLIHKAHVHAPGRAPGPAPAHVRRAVQRALGDGKRVAITKADTYKQICYGIVLTPEFEDTQGDVISAEEIEKSAHQWMASSRIIGLEHGEPIDAVPVESFICPMDMHFDGPQGQVDWPQGSWVMGVKFMDAKHFQMALDGEITGFSVGGLGLRT